MNEERVEVAAGELARWLVIALVVLIGTGCFFWLAPTTPVIATTVEGGLS
jgi:hypothetical protein